VKDKEWERAIEKFLIENGWDTWRALQVKVNRGPMWLNLRADLWGCIDIAAMHPERGFLFVQATTTKGVNERRRKIETHGWPILNLDFSAPLEGLTPEEVEVVTRWWREYWTEAKIRIIGGYYKVQVWESRARRSMADSRKWEYGARVHTYIPFTKEWKVAADVIPIASAASSTRPRTR